MWTGSTRMPRIGERVYRNEIHVDATAANGVHGRVAEHHGVEDRVYPAGPGERAPSAHLKR
jgi:hypothetical protein